MPTQPASELDDLRREIDRVDAAVLELFEQRLAVVSEIARHKRGAQGLPLRPGREAVIMRRLVRQAGGRLPKATLVRMWRELLAATTRAQGSYSVGVVVPGGQPRLWDVARDHFGSLTPIEPVRSAEEALRQAGADRTRIAVLPLPDADETWWTRLDGASGTPRVVMRLPFAPLPGYPEGIAALAVAALAQEPSGDDLTLVALETGEAGRSLRELLKPYEPRFLGQHGEAGRSLHHLVELRGFLSAQEPGLLDALARIGGSAVVIGVYPRPLHEAELA